MKRFYNNRGSATLIAEALILAVMIAIAVVAYNITQRSSCERSSQGSHQWLSCDSVLDCEHLENKKDREECKPQTNSETTSQ